MINKVKPIPDGFQVITPMLAVRHAAAALEFYQQAFGAIETMRLTRPGDKIAYAEFTIGGARITLADESPGYNHTPESLGGTTVLLHLYVEDVDVFVERAVAAGATLLIPVDDQFYGDRSGRLGDPFGHIWVVATHQEDVSTQEMQRRMEALYGGG